MAWKQSPITPTAEQARIEHAKARRVIVEANAGVGKTTALCLRVLRMIREEGADPARILMLTFTEPGAEAIRRTIARLGAPASLAQRLGVRTFDQFCAVRLRRMGEPAAQDLRRPEQVKGAVLAAIQAARDRALQSGHEDDFKLHGSGHLIVERLLKDFERLKGAMVLRRQDEEFRLTPDSALETGFDFTTLAIFQAYEADRLGGGPGRDEVRFRTPGDATYDMACALSAADPVFSYENHPLRVGPLHAVVVDEFHDMNWAMATVLRELLSLYPELPFTGVGDVDQVIHAESGADSYFLRAGFHIEFGRAERMTLTHAQRFGPGIAQALEVFARKPYPSHPERGGRLEVLQLDSTQALVQHLRRVRDERQAAKAPLSEVAVLLRHPSAALDLEYGLLNAGVDYETAGFASYTSRPEMLFVRLLLAAAVGSRDAFTEASFQAAKLAAWEFIGGALPLAGGGDDPDTMAKIINAPAGAFLDFMLEDLLARTPRAQAAACVREAMNIARGDRVPDLVPALKALRMARLAEHVLVKAEAIRGAAASVLALERLVERENFLSITEMLRVIRAQEERQQQDWSARQRLVLSTIEQSKGLEYEHVLIPGLNQGQFDGDDEDERHRFYVAVSRAKHLVQLIRDPGPPSRFLPRS